MRDFNINPDACVHRNSYVIMKKLMILLIIILYACEKETVIPEEPKQRITVKVTTLPATNTRGESATLNGKVEITGDVEWTYGFSYGESSSMRPNSTSAHKGVSSNFSIRMNNRFYPRRTYYYNAYVNYGGKTVYGNVVSFATEY